MHARFTVLVIGVLVLVGCATCPLPQPAVPVQPEGIGPAWAPFSFLVGDWEGVSGGEPGAGTGSFTLEPDMQGHVLVRRGLNVSPKLKHEDLTVIYKDRKGFAATYFDNEDHVITYRVTAIDAPKSVVFVSDEIPGVPRFRLSYIPDADGTMLVRFEIAMPGSADFKTHVEGKVKKRP